MKYYVLLNDRSLTDGVIIDQKPTNGPKGYLYDKLKSLQKIFPKSAKIYYSDNYPDGTELYDFIDNTDRILIVSDKVKDVIEQYQKSAIEFLPVQVFDHAEKCVENAKYYILNGYENVDYIDLQNTEVVMDSFFKDIIFSIKSKIYINEAKIPSNVHIFRAANYPEAYVVSEELANSMRAAGLTGYQLQETYTKSN